MVQDTNQHNMISLVEFLNEGKSSPEKQFEEFAQKRYRATVLEKYYTNLEQHNYADHSTHIDHYHSLGVVFVSEGRVS